MRWLLIFVVLLWTVKWTVHFCSSPMESRVECSTVNMVRTKWRWKKKKKKLLVPSCEINDDSTSDVVPTKCLSQLTIIFSTCLFPSLMPVLYISLFFALCPLKNFRYQYFWLIHPSDLKLMISFCWLLLSSMSALFWRSKYFTDAVSRDTLKAKGVLLLVLISHI